ncbi:MAG: class II glutamine amidotransferase [Vampirovibrionales bacterium]
MMVLLQAKPCEAQDDVCQATLAQYVFEDARSFKRQGHPEQPYYQLGGVSTPVNAVPGVVPNIDGAGMIAYAPLSTVTSSAMVSVGYFRQSKALLEEDTTFRRTFQDWIPRASVWLLHNRAATVGIPTPENNHPFQVKLSDRPGDTWSFMGNGGSPLSMASYRRHITDPRILKANPLAQQLRSSTHKPQMPQQDALVAEMTDTERLFHLILQKALPTLDGKPLSQESLPAFKASVLRTYQHTMSQYPIKVLAPFSQGKGYQEAKGPEGFLTPDSRYPRQVPNSVVLSNGEYTFLLLHEYPLFYQLRHSVKHPQEVETVIVASEPTNLATFYAQGQTFPSHVTRWQWIPDHTLVTLHREATGRITMHWEPIVLKVPSRLSH